MSNLDRCLYLSGLQKLKSIDKLKIPASFADSFPVGRDPAPRLLAEYLRPNSVYFAIPIYTPHRNMPDFEPYRASLEDLESLRPYLREWGQDESEILEKARRSTVAYAVDQLAHGPDLQSLFAEKQQELYLSLHQDGRLYVWNSGSETCCIGDLRSLDLQAVTETIAATPGTQNYGAFYDLAALPSEKDLVRALSVLPHSTLYGDSPSVIYRGLSEMNVPTRLMF